VARELGSAGARVVVNCPNDRDARDSKAARHDLLKLIPYQRIGEVEDVARVVRWLTSDDSDYVVGTTIVVDGGMTLSPGFRGNG
jgi:glucose 1-dehydrogenase